MDTFSDKVTHRDFLGSLMNLGIEREQLGDIYTDGTKGYVYVLNKMAPYICRELTRVKRTSINCFMVSPKACDFENKYEEVKGSVASERLDVILAFVYHLSRTVAQTLIEGDQVFISGRGISNTGYRLKLGERVSVKGYGKYIYEGIETTTKKGRFFITVKKFI